MAKNTDLPGKSDHLKYYCVVFAVLVIVIGIVALKQRSTLQAYQAASTRAHAMLHAKGKTTRGRPKGVGELAVEVEKFVKGYRESVGGDAGDAGGDGISLKLMAKAERSVNMTNFHASPGHTDDHPAKGYRTHSREFSYGPCDLKQFTTLVYNIERLGRYRVFELRWKLADDKVNSQAPFNKITKPTISVGYRQPLTRKER